MVNSFKRYRSFNIVNIGSVDERALKLPAFKVEGVKKKSAVQPRPHLNRSARIRVGPGSNHSQSLMAGNFAALWPTDPKFSALKDLNPFKTVSKVQEASSILRVVFALSKWPHLLRVYLVTVRFHLILAVLHKSEWKWYSGLIWTITISSLDKKDTNS